MSINRRKFIGSTCMTCGAILGAGIITGGMESCKTTSEAATTSAPAGLSVVNNRVTIPITDLAGFEQKAFDVKGLTKPLLVKSQKDGTYHCILMKCTHMGGALQLRDGEYVCNLHGSVFSADGKVIKGPAKTPLVTYPASVDGKMLVITITS